MYTIIHNEGTCTYIDSRKAIHAYKYLYACGLAPYWVGYEENISPHPSLSEMARLRVWRDEADAEVRASALVSTDDSTVAYAPM